jgi:Acyl-CoA carboxylase epsilon subunit
MVIQPADDDQSPARPLLRVVRGDATPEEIAALVAVLLATRSAQDDAPAAPSRSAWSDRSARMRGPLQPGPGGWRRSALPY